MIFYLYHILVREFYKNNHLNDQRTIGSSCYSIVRWVCTVETDTQTPHPPRHGPANTHLSPISYPRPRPQSQCSALNTSHLLTGSTRILPLILGGAGDQLSVIIIPSLSIP